VLYGLWGNAKNDLYMVGSQGNILHYDGKNWDSSGLFTTSDIRGVWGTSGDNVYVVGDGGSIQHFDGKKWSFMSSNTVNQLYGIWGTSENDIFAVGQFGTIIHYGELNVQPSTPPNSSSNPSPSQTTTTPVKQGVPEPSATNWGLIGGIAGAVVVVGGITWFALSRRAKKTASK
jgi:hypothetical protein